MDYRQPVSGGGEWVMLWIAPFVPQWVAGLLLSQHNFNRLISAFKNFTPAILDLAITMNGRSIFSKRLYIIYKLAGLPREIFWPGAIFENLGALIFLTNCLTNSCSCIFSKLLGLGLGLGLGTFGLGLVTKDSVSDSDSSPVDSDSDSDSRVLDSTTTLIISTIK